MPVNRPNADRLESRPLVPIQALGFAVFEQEQQRSEDALKDEDNLRNQDDPKNEDSLKSENNLKM